MNRKKAALLVALAIILAAVPALAASNLFSGYRSNKAKIEAFTEWFTTQNFTTSEYNAWADAFSQLTGVSTNTVYVTGKGTRYHANPNCSSLSKSYEIIAITLDDAFEYGYAPCSRCVK